MRAQEHSAILTNLDHTSITVQSQPMTIQRNVLTRPRSPTKRGSTPAEAGHLQNQREILLENSVQLELPISPLLFRLKMPPYPNILFSPA